MANRLEASITKYCDERTESNLAELDIALVEERFHVPVATAVKELEPGRYDVPVVCLKTEAGAGAIPAFTTVEQLLNWKPEGQKYTTVTGAALIAMASDMPGISEIRVNPNGAPRGLIPRAEFSRLLSLK